MRYLFILSAVVCLSFMLLPACAPPAEQAEPVTEEAPSTEADVEAIKAAVKQYADLVTAGDVEGFVALFSADCVVLPPNAATITGKAAWSSYAKATFFDPFDMDEEIAIQETEIAGDWAFVRGTYKLQVTPKTGGEMTPNDGKFIFILGRQGDGSWTITHQIWNNDNPPPGAPAS